MTQNRSKLGLIGAVMLAASSMGGGVAQSVNSERVMRALDKVERGQQAPGQGVVKNSPAARLSRGAVGKWRSRNTKRGPGWSCAHVKRMARKRRNKVAHRAKVQANGGRARA